jgi:hypothetical protein
MCRNLFAALKCHFSYRPSAYERRADYNNTRKVEPGCDTKKTQHAVSRKVEMCIVEFGFRVLVSISRCKCAFMQIDPPAAASWIFYRAAARSREREERGVSRPFCSLADFASASRNISWMAQAKVLENDMFEQRQPADVFALVSLRQTIVSWKLHTQGRAVNYLKGCCEEDFCV